MSYLLDISKLHTEGLKKALRGSFYATGLKKEGEVCANHIKHCSSTLEILFILFQLLLCVQTA